MKLVVDEDEESSFKKMSITFIISCIIYLLYLEINPKIRNIWIRKDANKVRTIGWHSLSTLRDFITYPFKDSRLWLPIFWDINIFVSVPILTGILYWSNQYFHR